MVSADSGATTVRTAEDTYVLVGNANKVNGLDQTLIVGNCSGNAERRAFVRFSDELQLMSADRPVSRAVLRLWASAVAGPATLEVYRLRSPWTEQTLTGTTQPLMDSGPQATFGIAPADANSYVSVDITNVYREWQNGTANYGIALRTTPTSAGCVSFDSSESGGTSHDPEIELVRGESADVITSLSAGAGIAITGSGNSRTIVNTGDTNPDDEIRSVSPGPGIGIAITGTDRQVINTGDANPFDDITSLTAGPGVAISGSGGSRTVTNTGDINPGDDITSLTAGSGISISGSGASRTISKAAPPAGSWKHSILTEGGGRYLWDTERLNTDPNVLERTSSNEGIQLKSAGLYFITATVAVHGLAADGSGSSTLTVRPASIPPDPLRFFTDFWLVAGHPNFNSGNGHLSAVVHVTEPSVVEVWVTMFGRGNRANNTTLKIFKLD